MTELPRARGLDVSGDNQLPARMRFGEWAPLGFCFGFVEVVLGERRVPHAREHRALMRAAGYLTAPYGALHERYSPIETAKILIGERAGADELPDMLDAERPGLTEAMIRACCDHHHANATVPLLMYTGFPFWVGHVPAAAQPYYADLDLAIAGYPFDSSPDAQGHDVQPMDARSVALRSNPPAAAKPIIPPPWSRYWAWQHTGHGSLPGYAGFLDLHVHRLTQVELRARYGAGGQQQPPPADADAELAAAIRAGAIDIQGLVS